MLADSVLSRYVCTVRGWLLMVVGNLIGADTFQAGRRRSVRFRDRRFLSKPSCIVRSDGIRHLETKRIVRNCRRGTCASQQSAGFSEDQDLQEQALPVLVGSRRARCLETS